MKSSKLKLNNDLLISMTKQKSSRNNIKRDLRLEISSTSNNTSSVDKTLNKNDLTRSGSTFKTTGRFENKTINLKKKQTSNNISVTKYASKRNTNLNLKKVNALNDPNSAINKTQPRTNKNRSNIGLPSINPFRNKELSSSVAVTSGFGLKNQQPFLQVIDELKKILNLGMSNPLHFLNKDIISCDIEDKERFNLDRLLKVNNFCEEIESLEIGINTLKNRTLSFNTSIDETNENIVKLQSERRKGVYESLVHTCMENLEEIIYITTKLGLDNQNQTNPFNKIRESPFTRIEEKSAQYERTPNFKLGDSSPRSPINLNLNVNIGGINIHRLNSDKNMKPPILKTLSKKHVNKKMTSNIKLIHISNNTSLDSSRSVSADSVIIDENVLDVLIPSSQIRHVNLHSRNNIQTSFSKAVTMIDISTIQPETFNTNSLYKMYKENKSNLDKSREEVSDDISLVMNENYQGKMDVFFEARDEIEKKKINQVIKVYNLLTEEFNRISFKC